jgi:hypothetical protein
MANEIIFLDANGKCETFEDGVADWYHDEKDSVAND